MVGELYLIHSAKGSTWQKKDHKWIDKTPKKNGNGFNYKYSVSLKDKTVRNYDLADDDTEIGDQIEDENGVRLYADYDSDVDKMYYSERNPYDKGESYVLFNKGLRTINRAKRKNT